MLYILYVYNFNVFRILSIKLIKPLLLVLLHEDYNWSLFLFIIDNFVERFDQFNLISWLGDENMLLGKSAFVSKLFLCIEFEIAARNIAFHQCTVNISAILSSRGSQHVDLSATEEAIKALESFPSI